jgi:hypothetical protein
LTHTRAFGSASPDNCLHNDNPRRASLKSNFMTWTARKASGVSKTLLVASAFVFICLIGQASADVTNNSASDRKFRPWSDLSDKDKAKMSSDAVSQMRQMLKEMFQKLEDARDSKDIEKLNCVNADVATSKALVDFAERADLQLQELLARGEKKQAAEDELNKTMIALGKVKSLRAESDDCMGGFRFLTDELTTVDVVVQPGLPAGDPTDPPRPPPVVSRPPPASPI